jgi:adenosylcobyric acid synthase
MSGGLLVAGTSSDAGKSLLTAGICRWLARQGVRVAPFKAQNMSNNSSVTLDGGEIGRAQAFQALACGLEPSVRFNPVLLKPGGDRTSQVVVLGKAVGTATAMSYRQRKAELSATVLTTLAGLRAEFDAVICEGAGSPAEINLRSTDIANMGLARAADLPVIVVGDIDRGGVFASLFGTLALLSKEDQALVAGFVINKFRGDPELLAPGLDMLTELTGRPVLGTLPYRADLWLDAEDSLSYSDDGVVGRPAPAIGAEWLRVAVARLPRMSNVTDIEALAAEPGVRVRLVSEPSQALDADLLIVPGSKSTVDDLAWLRESGLATAVLQRVAQRRPTLGICGGFQMLGTRITDTVESAAGAVDGLGVLPVTVDFAVEKTVRRVHGYIDDHEVHGYEIHHGVATVHSGQPMFRLLDGTPEGCRQANVWGTHWHGAFESDEFRRAFLTEVAASAGRRGFTVAPDTDFAALRLRAVDVLADLVEEHLDTAALRALIDHGAPTDLPFIEPGPPGRR